jgi:hypothetical protein
MLDAVLERQLTETGAKLPDRIRPLNANIVPP